MPVQYSSKQKAAWLNSLPKRASNATLVIENPEGEALIVKANYKAHWTFPGGVIDPGETPLEAARRETLEEVGIAIDPADISFVSVANRRSNEAETYQFVFRANSPFTNESEIRMQPDEIEDYVFVSKDEVLSGNRHYGKVIVNWAHGVEGYLEQSFGDFML